MAAVVASTDRVGVVSGVLVAADSVAIGLAAVALVVADSVAIGLAVAVFAAVVDAENSTVLVKIAAAGGPGVRTVPTT